MTVHLQPESGHFDMDLFIAEIHSEPAVWNYTSESYKNRIEKTKAWDKICATLYPNFPEMSDKEKNDTMTLLQRKWKSLRDSYNRELKKVKTVEDAFSKRKYIYFDQLSFLQPLAEQRFTLGHQEEKDVLKEEMMDSIPDQVEVELVAEDLAAPPPPQKKSRSSCSVRGEEPPPAEQLHQHLPLKPSKKRKKKKKKPKHRDEDILFCLSLVGDLKRVPEVLRTDAKCELLQVLKRYKIVGNPVYHSPAPPPPPYTDTSLLKLAKVEMGGSQGKRKSTLQLHKIPSSPSSSSSDDSMQIY